MGNENIKIDEYIHSLCIIPTATCTTFIPLSTCSKCRSLSFANLLFILRRLQFAAWKMDAAFTGLRFMFSFASSLLFFLSFSRWWEGLKALFLHFGHKFSFVMHINDLKKAFTTFCGGIEMKNGYFSLFSCSTPAIFQLNHHFILTVWERY